MLVIFDNDGMVRKQNLDEFYNCNYIKCRHLEDDAKFDFPDWETVGQMKDASHSREWFNPDKFNITMLGSGSYHHFSLYILEQRTKPFYLVMFDWHFDCGMSRWKWQRRLKKEIADSQGTDNPLISKFGGGNRYAFGGWVIACAHLPMCKGILLVGMGGSKWEEKAAIGPNGKEEYGITVLPSADDYHLFGDKLKEVIPQDDDTEVYITVCKDVLNKYELETDWNNGEMTEAELMSMLAQTKLHYGNRICGVDICGEKAKKGWRDDEAEFIHNNEVRHKLLNRKIIDLFGGQELYGKKSNI